jgi:hypothetical protein
MFNDQLGTGRNSSILVDEIDSDKCLLTLATGFYPCNRTFGHTIVVGRHAVERLGILPCGSSG